MTSAVALESEASGVVEDLPYPGSIEHERERQVPLGTERRIGVGIGQLNGLHGEAEFIIINCDEEWND